MYKEKIVDETRVHITLWKTSKMLQYILEQNLKYVQEEYIYANILLLQYFTLEAFLNFLGENIRPTIWKKERQYFNKNAFHDRRGTLGKFWYLAEELRCEEYFDSGEGKTVYKFVEQDLKVGKGFFVHAKPEILQTESLTSQMSRPKFIENFIDRNINLKIVNEGFSSVELLILKFHNMANELEKYDINIENPLFGPDRVLHGSSELYKHK